MVLCQDVLLTAWLTVSVFLSLHHSMKWSCSSCSSLHCIITLSVMVSISSFSDSHVKGFVDFLTSVCEVLRFVSPGVDVTSVFGLLSSEGAELEFVFM